MELERHENILIIGHQAILRCIYAYFMNYNHEDLPYIKIPLHTVIELTPKAYGCEEKRFKGKIFFIVLYFSEMTIKLTTINYSGH
jgi:6-phosphofructo-2-kinase/fructose-2,6-biphosphatase 2